jgi:rubrerythrin
MRSATELKTARTWAEFDHVRVTNTVRFQSIIERLLISEGRRAATEYLSGGERAAREAVSDADWQACIVRMWHVSVVDASAAADRFLGLTGDRTAAYESAASRIIEANGTDRARGIAETSRKNITRIIDNARGAEETNDQIASAIESETKRIAAWRSETISATEVHGASWYAAWVAAMESGRPLIKVWLAPRAKGITCDQHLALHGQRRHINTKFLIGVWWLMYPGDTTNGAPPEQTINCRCDMGLYPVRRTIHQ